MKPRGQIEEPKGGSPRLYMKKISMSKINFKAPSHPTIHEKNSMSKIDFKAIWNQKKIKSGK